MKKPWAEILKSMRPPHFSYKPEYDLVSLSDKEAYSALKQKVFNHLKRISRMSRGWPATQKKNVEDWFNSAFFKDFKPEFKDLKEG